MSLYDDLQANAPKAGALDSAFASQMKRDRSRGEAFAPVPLRNAPYDRSYYTTVAPFRIPGIRVEVMRQDDPEASVLIGVFTDRNFDNNGQEVHILVDNLVCKTMSLLSPRQAALRVEEGEAQRVTPDDAVFGARCVQTCRVPFGDANSRSIEVVTQGMALFYNVFDKDAEPEVLDDADVPHQKGRFLGLDGHGDLVGWVADTAGETTAIEAIVDQSEKSVYLGCFALGAFRKKARVGSKLFRIPINALPTENRQSDGSIMTRVVLRELGTTAPLGQGAFHLLRRGDLVFWWRMRMIDDTRIVGSVVCLNDDLQTVTVSLSAEGREVWSGEATVEDSQDLDFHRLKNTFDIEADIPEEFTVTFKVKGGTLTTGLMRAASFKR